MSKRSFMCFVGGHGSEWEAICTDLDIAVNADSERQVRERLTYAIRTYIEDVGGLDEASRNRLLSRKSPWYVTWGWKIRVAVSALRSRSDDQQFAAFGVPCRV